MLTGAAWHRPSHRNLLFHMNLPTQLVRPAGASRVVTAPFAVAATMLVAAAVLAGPVAKWLNIKQAKLPLPLRAPLTALSEEGLAPYVVRRRHVLESAVVEALGTDQYLSWTLEDTDVPPDDPLRYANLLVTYDTGGRSLVPHRPEVCFLGSGYEPAQAHENLELELDRPGVLPMHVPVRVCTFARTALRDRTRISVVYLFYCNGEFIANPFGVRMMLNKPTNTYAFFSKVEISFPRGTRSENIKGTRKLLDRVLPLLVSSHWPDFKSAEDAAE